jgi:hypothetical protein
MNLNDDVLVAISAACNAALGSSAEAAWKQIDAGFIR